MLLKMYGQLSVSLYLFLHYISFYLYFYFFDGSWGAAAWFLITEKWYLSLIEYFSYKEGWIFFHVTLFTKQISTECLLCAHSVLDPGNTMWAKQSLGCRITVNQLYWLLIYCTAALDGLFVALQNCVHIFCLHILSYLNIFLNPTGKSSLYYIKMSQCFSFWHSHHLHVLYTHRNHIL